LKHAFSQGGGFAHCLPSHQRQPGHWAGGAELAEAAAVADGRSLGVAWDTVGEGFVPEWVPEAGGDVDCGGSTMVAALAELIAVAADDDGPAAVATMS
jgi:hypothetical protein